MNCKKNKTSIKSYHLLIGAGLILLFCAGSLQVRNLVDDYLAGQRAQRVLAELQQNPQPASYLPDNTDITEPLSEEQLTEQEPEAEELAEEEAQEQAPPAPSPKYTIIGAVSVPSLNLNLPLLDECSDPLLKISICRYQGIVEPQPQRLVIAGHNYKSHFGRIPKLNVGDEVSFTSAAGETYTYAVSEITEIAGDDHAGLAEGEWDITMFTCTPDSKNRILVRCQII